MASSQRHVSVKLVLRHHRHDFEIGPSERWLQSEMTDRAASPTRHVQSKIQKDRQHQRSTPVYESTGGVVGSKCSQCARASSTLLLLNPVAEMLENVKLPLLVVDPVPVLPDPVL